MSWSLPIFRIAGIQLRIHITFLLLIGWLAVGYYAQGGSAMGLGRVLFVLLLFVCVVLHEFGHAIAAKNFGINTPDITLLPIGGVARLQRMPDEPRQELIIALAGPLVNVVIALTLFAVVGWRGLAAQAAMGGPDLLAQLLVINVVLVLFNLLPAFPMDGGRVLRALLATRLSYTRATQIAASIGQGCAFIFGFIGLFGNPMLLFIALFVYLGAAQEAALAQWKDATANVPVSEAMATQIEVLPASATLDEAAEAVLRTSQHEFAVVDEAERVLGILTREDSIAALRQRRGDTPVSSVIRRHLAAVRPDDPLDEAFIKMQKSGYPALPVIDARGRLVGLITAENVGEMMIIR